VLTQKPGVLPRQALRAAVEVGWVKPSAPIPPGNFQPASLDLTLGPTAYRLQCSFLPGRDPVRAKLRLYEMEELDLSHGAVLEQNRPYLVPLRERLALPPGIRARANPRSSTGRLDVFTRVLVDRGQHFDDIPDGYHGELFLEVVPRSFTIKVREGDRLNQLRLLSGSPAVDDKRLRERHRDWPLVFARPNVASRESAWIAGGLFLSVDLSRTKNLQYVGYRAKKSSALIDLSLSDHYKISDFWEQVPADAAGRLILEPEEFYLLVSRERIRVPPDYAAEMSAYEPTSGELRTHYAGFFDPGFGDVVGEPGTAAVLEVRAHDVSFALEHGQRLCKLTFEQMQEPPEVVYGASLGSRYQGQFLALGRQFKTTTYTYARGANPRELGARPMDLQLVTTESDVVPMALAASSNGADAPKATRRRSRIVEKD
jgi:dCTP deaminase